MLFVTAILPGAGAVYQAVGAWRDARRFAQSGKSIAAAGVRLNLDCRGNGHPTVILESGSGVPAAGWMLVQPSVSTFTRVCSYDRAGYGWSSTAEQPRTGSHIAQELKAVLDAAGETGPYVLVGHSFGGLYIRIFTALYPADVVGVVLVDASAEDAADVEVPAGATDLPYATICSAVRFQGLGVAFGCGLP